MVDAAHDKEQRARETIQSLKLEISNLSKLVEQGAGLSMGQDHRFVTLVKKKNTGVIWRVLAYPFFVKLENFNQFFSLKKYIVTRLFRNNHLHVQLEILILDKSHIMYSSHNSGMISKFTLFTSFTWLFS